MPTDSCDHCGDNVEEALSRTVELQVGGSQVDRQVQCPSCFAEWIDRYQQGMGGSSARSPGPEDEAVEGGGSDEIIVD